MKVITSAICDNCSEVYDAALYRVCPACASEKSMFLSAMINKVTVQDEPGDDIPTKKCK